MNDIIHSSSTPSSALRRLFPTQKKTRTSFCVQIEKKSSMSRVPEIVRYILFPLGTHFMLELCQGWVKYFLIVFGICNRVLMKNGTCKRIQVQQSIECVFKYVIKILFQTRIVQYYKIIPNAFQFFF
jgi:hypothetical protein